LGSRRREVHDVDREREVEGLAFEVLRLLTGDEAELDQELLGVAVDRLVTRSRR